MNRSKLLAAVAVMAMVFAAVAVVSFDGNESNAAVDNPSGNAVSDGSFEAVVDEIKGGNVQITTKSVTIPEGKTLTIPEGKTLYIVGESNNTNEVQLIVNGTLEIEGSLKNNAGTNKASTGIVNNGKIVTSGTGNIMTTSAMGGNGSTDAYFTVISTASGEYKHLWTASLSEASTKACAAPTTGYDGNAKRIFAYGNVTTGSTPITIGSDVLLNLGAISNGQNATMDVEANLTVGDMVVPSGSSATLGTDIELTNNGKMQVSGKITGTGKIVNVENSTITIIPGGSIKNGMVTGEGAVIGGSSWETVNLSGVLESDVVGKPNQKIVVSDDLEVRSGVTITVAGEFIIEAGATVTFDAGSNIVFGSTANATIDGDLIISEGTDALTTFVFDGNSMMVSGTVTIGGANAFESSKPVSISGAFNVNEDGDAKFTDATVMAGGELNIMGDAEGTVINNGTVTINTIEVIEDLTIKMRDAGILDAINVNGSVNVTDEGMTFKTNGVDVPVSGVNGITLKNVAGVTISEKLIIKTENNKRTGTAEMYISGTVISAIDAEGAATTDANIKITEGTVVIEGEMSLGKVGITVDATLDVKGTLNAKQAKENNVLYTIDGTGTVDVTGLIVTADPVADGVTINASFYTTTEGTVTYNNYTTLENAVASGASTITLYGAATVSKDLTIPAGTTIKMDGESTLTIAETSTMTVQNGAKFNTLSEECVYVDGTLVVENFAKSGVGDAAVSSDVDKKSGTEKEYTMTFTNIYTALETAADGEVVKLRANEVNITKDVAVPAGATLQIDSDKTVNVEGVTLTVDGKVIVEGEYNMVAMENNTAATIVNGLFLYNTNNNYEESIAGAFFSYDGTNAIAPVAFAAENIDAIDGDVTIRGEVSIDDVVFDYTNGGTVTLFVKGDLKAGTITLKNVVFDSTDATNVNATVAMTNGSVKFENAVDAVLEDVVSYDAENVATYTVALSGTITKSDATGIESAMVTINGKVDSTANIGNGVTLMVPTDAILSIKGACTIDTIVVEGTVETNVTNVTIVTATIIGAFNTGSGAAVTVTTLYVGIESADLLTGAAATVGDKVKLADSGVAYVAPGSTVGKMITNLKKTEYYVENELYLTAFVGASANKLINSIKATVENAEFKNWVDSDGNIVSGTIGTKDKVYATIDYEIFTIDLSSIPGVIVYIDGKEYTSNMKFAAGEHTITTYLKAGYEGAATVTFDGTAVTDGKFTITGDSANKIVVSGVSAATAGGNSDKGMSLTDYLLIILVVMVVILAIVVIMRMMRS